MHFFPAHVVFNWKINIQSVYHLCRALFENEVCRDSLGLLKAVPDGSISLLLLLFGFLCLGVLLRS
jgi:hypothetical protein